MCALALGHEAFSLQPFSKTEESAQNPAALWARPQPLAQIKRRALIRRQMIRQSGIAQMRGQYQIVIEFWNQI